MVKLSVTLLNILNGHLDKDLLSCPKLVKEKKKYFTWQEWFLSIIDMKAYKYHSVGIWVTLVMSWELEY